MRSPSKFQVQKEKQRGAAPTGAARSESTMEDVEVEIPDGCYPGDLFTVCTADGQELDVEVPLDCEPGMLLTVALPLVQPAGEQNVVEVVVPDGCFAGMEFTVEFNGQTFNVTVPDGCIPGDPIVVEVPTAEESDEPPPPPPPPQPPPPIAQSVAVHPGQVQAVDSCRGAAERRLLVTRDGDGVRLERRDVHGDASRRP